jgi:uncharacterized protein (DUF433 family)
MGLEIGAETVPLLTDADGVVRVGATRVTLETLIATFNEGATAEEIVSQFPTLQLADVYAVIAYCLRRPEEVEGYLQQRRDRAKKVREMNESRFDPKGVRDRLLARRPKES